MNEQQNKVMALFDELKNDCKCEILSHGMKKYEFIENGWTYTFFTDNDKLKKFECFNHRELTEIYF